MSNRVFTVTPAVREQVPLLIGLVSPSGGGKTYSALRLATGIKRVCDGPIIVIDTENRRSLHYADAFKFLHVPFAPPFNPIDYLAALKYAASQKPSCIIVDSMTHEHSGEGGYLDTAEKVIDRIAGDDYGKRERAKFAGWAKAGPMRTTLIEGIKQLSGNMIFCWRGKEKTKPVKTSSGRMEVVEMGMMAIGGADWIYEMTINCLLPARSNGVPDWEGADPGERLQMKLPVQFRNLFQPGTVLSEDIGQQMAQWALGGVPVVGRSTAASLDAPPVQEMTNERRAEVYEALNKAAYLGREPFVKAWNKARQEWQHMAATKVYFRDLRDPWLTIADEVDDRAKRAARGEIEDDAPLPPPDEMPPIPAERS